ncbi:hypothetical protein AVEN_196694-1 [Araneus ventricosus]|uniref:Uncharacterized protein n=1 Tax=Araneus ventricosus TaxID=182803 RepID=A0A4Y2KZX8_ARAVE|nr:hypothetical protein AVEN_196694-1 [Araneus ventricosus]
MRRENLSSRSKTYEIWSKWIRSGGIQNNSKSKTPYSDSNLGSRCEGSGETKVLPTLGPRVEARNESRNPSCGEEFCDFEPCLKTNSGTSVNDLPNFSTKMSGIQTSLYLCVSTGGMWVTIVVFIASTTQIG